MRTPTGLVESAVMDRRTAVRYFCNLDCRLVVEDDPANSFPALIHNVSQTGVGLILEQSFEPGTILAVEFQNPELGLARVLLASVVHTRPQVDGRWLVGGSLVTQLNDDELHELVGSPDWL